MKFLTALALLTALLFAPLALAETASAQTSHSQSFHRHHHFGHYRFIFQTSRLPRLLTPNYRLLPGIPEQPLTTAR